MCVCVYKYYLAPTQLFRLKITHPRRVFTCDTYGLCHHHHGTTRQQWTLLMISFSPYHIYQVLYYAKLYYYYYYYYYYYCHATLVVGRCFWIAC